MTEIERLIKLTHEGRRKWYESYGCLLGLEKYIANYLLDNGVIVPPCKVGDYVYYIKGGYYKKPEHCEVSKPCKVVEVSFKLQRNGNRVMRGFITDNGTRYSFDSIGKTVFLSRELAEKALAERSNQ